MTYRVRISEAYRNGSRRNNDALWLVEVEDVACLAV
jgi:hypothetical protein